jgi:hypothetical protein
MSTHTGVYTLRVYSKKFILKKMKASVCVLISHKPDSRSEDILVLTVTGATSLPALPNKGDEIRVPRYEEECSGFFVDVTHEDYGGMTVSDVDHLWVRRGLLQPRINIEFSVRGRQDLICLIHQLTVWLTDLTGWVPYSSDVSESFAHKVGYNGDDAKRLFDAIAETLPSTE